MTRRRKHLSLSTLGWTQVDSLNIVFTWYLALTSGIFPGSLASDSRREVGDLKFQQYKPKSPLQGLRLLECPSPSIPNRKGSSAQGKVSNTWAAAKTSVKESLLKDTGLLQEQG